VTRALVIGIGNDLRGDDGAGTAVAARVAARAAPGVRVVAVQQLGPELAEEVACADAVIFVDASTLADRVTVREVGPAPGARAAGSHTLDPAALLALYRDAYGRGPGAAWQVEVPAAHFEVGEPLSDATRSAVHEAVAVVRELLDRRGE
jgi:hydrogenase maturation protease